MPRFSPEEDAILLPYVDKMCRWDEVMPHLERPQHSAARRLVRLRRQHGTIWRIDQRKRARDENGRLI